MNTIKYALFGLWLAVGSLAQAQPVNINTADANRLAANINGVGPVLAQAIVAHRQAHGPFRSPEALLAVKGIGPRLLERIRPDLKLDTPAPAKAKKAAR
ncbi:MAG: helix-hairpin-helix domain-containing protein [Gammaproteobacteria bacterium]|nr:helix-hairpin-helix domain-containing protein [Gammaproteobacteria bacterium]